MLDRTVREAAARFGDHPAFVMADDPDRRLTYEDLDRSSDEVAAGLSGRGVAAGDLVALVLPPDLSYPVAYAAAAKLGAVTVGVNHRLTETERDAVLERLAPRVVLAAPGEVESLHETGWDPPPLHPDPDRWIAVCLTSGTTGPPKAAVFASRQLEAITAIDVGETWGGGGVSLAATSFAHLGPMTKLPGGLRRGGTTVIMPSWHPGRALDAVERFGITSLGGIPTQIAMMLDVVEDRTRDLSSLRLIVMGGGPATPGLIRRTRESFGVPVCVRYSCTEAGIGVGTRPDDPPEDAEQSVGRAHAGVDLAIRRNGQDLPSGEVGEVLLRSGAVMCGYLDDPDATAEALTEDGFARTGDLGWVDESGRLHLAGRTSEMYVRGGYNVHPTEVEAVLAEHPQVAQVAIVALTDEVYGEIGVAVVVPAGDPPTLEDLRAFAGERLAKHKLPERLEVTTSLPLTANHKLDRRTLTILISERTGP